MPKVTVIVPVYNVEKYLPECLDSILNQSLTDIEIICVNDVSPDNSASILKEYSEKDERVRIITHEQNQGLGPARNSGVAVSTAPYISFIDSDDFIAPNMMESLYKLITSEKAEMAWCGTAKVSETGVLLEPGNIPNGIWSAIEVLKNEKLFPSIQTVTNKLFVRDIIKDIKQLPILIEDEPTIAQYLAKCTKVVTTNESFYFYRTAPESISNPSEHKPDYWISFFNDYKFYFNILKEEFPHPEILNKQVIFRVRSLLWRINTYRLLDASNWDIQRKVLLDHLKNNYLPLKKYCMMLYFFIMLVLKAHFKGKNKYHFIKIGLSLSKATLGRNCSILFFPIHLMQAYKPLVKKLLVLLFDRVEIVSYILIALMYKIIIHKPLWLVGERNDTAQENGLYFFRYIKREQKNENAYYIIDKKSPDCDLLKDFGNVVDFNSHSHKILYFMTKYYVTAHNHFCKPATYFGKKQMAMRKKTLNVFLDHGITYADVSEFYGKKNSGIDLFICGAKPEYDHVVKAFGYEKNEVAYTGFARFDGLHNIQSKNQILVMPTWRRDIYDLKKQNLSNKKESFKNSNYYKTFQSLINNEDLLNMLERFNYQLIFYPHYEIQDFLDCFSSTNNNVILASKNDYKVQELLKEAALLIVDTSSVSFDFAYMFKPLIYFRFDKETFTNEHLNPGYFKHETMGFGPVVEKEKQVIASIENYLENKCVLEMIYHDRIKKFYPLHDANNSKRIYNAIKNYA
jgi:glycosyltransferase involved in cell wall biosynthesis/CDP-glycerol glycerophosphotransferase (TagB/SpsB family)